MIILLRKIASKNNSNFKSSILQELCLKKNFPARIVLKACRLVSGQAIETTTALMGNLIGRKRDTPSNCFTCCSTDTGANRPCNDHKCPTGLGKVVYCFPFMTFILFWWAIYTPNAYTEQIKVVLEFFYSGYFTFVFNLVRSKTFWFNSKKNQ